MLINVSDGEVFKEISMMKMLTTFWAGKHELSISVRVNAREAKGIMVIARKEYISEFGQEYLIV